MVEPADARPETPLVIALHGRGDKAEDFARVAEQLGQRVRTIVARGPVPWGRFNGKQWWNMRADDTSVVLAKAVDQLAALVKQLATTYPRADKPIVYGFSQGGMLALQTLARRPGLFKAVAGLSARLPSSTGNTRATKDQRVPVLLTTGRKDTIVPPKQTHAAATILKRLGYAPRTLEFERGHTIDATVTRELKSFIASHGGL